MSAEDVASIIGVSPATVYRYESAQIMSMRTDKLRPIAEALDTTPAFLMGWTDDPIDYDNEDLSDAPLDVVEHFNGDAKKVRAFQRTQDDDWHLDLQQFADPSCFLWYRPLVEAYSAAPAPTQQNVCKLLDLQHVVPDAPIAPIVREMIVYDYPAAAGLPLYAESDFERVEVPEDEVPFGADFGIRISGDSMEPTIADGSVVWVHKQVDIRDGQVGIFMVGDSAVCKRAFFDGRGCVKRLESDNPAYKPIVGDGLEGLRVVGKVLLAKK